MEINKRKRKISYKKYIITFFITLTIFVITFFAFEVLNNKRISYLEASKKDIQQEINSLNDFKIKFCEEIKEFPLINTFNNFKNNLEVVKESLGKENKEIIELEEGITLLQIEYLNLIKKANKKCQFKIIPIIFLYSHQKNEDKLNNYQKQKLVLFYLNQKYFNLRIFAFDSSLNLPEIIALKPKTKPNKKITNNILIIDEKVYSGFMSIEELEAILENLGVELKIKEK